MSVTLIGRSGPRAVASGVFKVIFPAGRMTGFMRLTLELIPSHAFQELNLVNAGVAIRAFTLHEIIAEKFRALLQQPIRNRNRRQDIYDIAYLIDGHELAGRDRATILDTLIIELGELPPFDERFAIVRDFYRSLPWR